jgi:hypothetical protein
MMGGSDYWPEFDERREIHRLLSYLDPPHRINLLGRCCQMVSTEGVQTRVTESSGSVGDVWHDIMLLAFDRGLRLEVIGKHLVRWVRRYGRAASR